MEGGSTPVQIGWRRGDPLDALLTREWLVTNALGGYASGTVGGACTRRFHGHLIAALPAPLARTMMLNHLEEVLEADGICYRLSGDEHGGGKEIAYPEAGFLDEFALECGMPVWRFSKNGIRIEKHVMMPHLQNSTYIIYRMLEGPPGLKLKLRPSLHFRPHEGLLIHEGTHEWEVRMRRADEIEIDDEQPFPPLRLRLLGENTRLRHDIRMFEHVLYRVEKSRGYEYEGPLWSPGVIEAELTPEDDYGIVASVERWEVMEALDFAEAWEAEGDRHRKMLSIAGVDPAKEFPGQLVLAADQFLVHPHTRVADEARVRAAGDAPSTVIAGYHWFTDWGRDTMISLEGLTLVTGRNREAGNILRTFASYIKDGLIPNLFPEGENAGLYHTADATMWFFHAVWRYFNGTHDRETVWSLIPKMIEIIDYHVRGTLFNIHVDPKDGLLSQGAEGYQLTWMDAKVDDWVVTPRRGKAVEINALWYNALSLYAEWLREEGDPMAPQVDEAAHRARESFNARFWCGECGHLYDVIDGEYGDDAACRPNQLFAISLDNPVLDELRWRQVFDVVRERLVTPVGLRSLAPGHRDYKAQYYGDLRARDAAYHQGTVWAWLVGPYVDAYLRVYPGDLAGARECLAGFEHHQVEAGVGTISEIFDAEEPFTPRGCVAQAWSVAEVLRAWLKTASR